MDQALKQRITKAEKTLNRDVHPDDQMNGGNLDRYFSVGEDALRKILGVMTLSGTSDPSSVLDYACGHGRVGRWLKSAFPKADLVGADTMKRALPHYQKCMQAEVHELHTDPQKVNLERKFDLIWSGSLITHLDETKAKKLLDCFSRHANDGGLIIFTSHGRFVASRWKEPSWPYNLSAERLKEISLQFDDGNYGYSDYGHMKGYGISMTPLPWIMEYLKTDPSLKLITLMEQGWDNHQDIIAFQKVG